MQKICMKIMRKMNNDINREVFFPILCLFCYCSNINICSWLIGFLKQLICRVVKRLDTLVFRRVAFMPFVAEVGNNSVWMKRHSIVLNCERCIEHCFQLLKCQNTISMGLECLKQIYSFIFTPNFNIRWKFS